MSNNDEEAFWVLEENDAFIARKVSGRNFKFKKNKGKGKSGYKKGSHQRGGFKHFRKSGSGGKANMANENYDPYDQAYWGKGKGKKGKKGKSKFQYPYDGNKVIHPMRMAKERADMKREIQDVRSHRREDGGAARHPADCTIHRAYLCRLDRPRLGSIMDMERTWLVLIP